MTHSLINRPADKYPQTIRLASRVIKSFFFFIKSMGKKIWISIEKTNGVLFGYWKKHFELISYRQQSILFIHLKSNWTTGLISRTFRIRDRHSIFTISERPSYSPNFRRMSCHCWNNAYVTTIFLKLLVVHIYISDGHVMFERIFCFNYLLWEKNLFIVLTCSKI